MSVDAQRAQRRGTAPCPGTEPAQVPMPPGTDTLAAQLRGDVRGVLWCLALQVLLLGTGFALGLNAGGSVQREPVPETSWTEYLAHNATVAAGWAAGAVTFGILTLAAVFVVNLLSGYALGALAGSEGLDVVTALPHAALELPAFAIAAWIGLWPLRAVVRRRRRSPTTVTTVSTVGTGSTFGTVTAVQARQAGARLGALVTVAAALLIGAAVVEAAVAPLS